MGRNIYINPGFVLILTHQNFNFTINMFLPCGSMEVVSLTASGCLLPWKNMTYVFILAKPFWAFDVAKKIATGY